ncbi:hypothetical protein [Spirosoma arcticum]
MERLIALGLVLMLASPLSGWAQAQPQSPATAGFRLKDCIDFGLKNFGSIRIAQYQVETANEQARQALGQYLPQVN